MPSIPDILLFLIAALYLGMSILSLIAYASDKRRARCGRRRIPERTLLTIDLDTPLPDADCCTVTLSGDVSGAIEVRPLSGDVNRDAVVSTADASLVKPHFGEPLDGVNFLFDYNADGVISTADFSQIKPRFGGGAAVCP